MWLLLILCLSRGCSSIWFHMVPLKFAMRTMRVAGNVCARIYREKTRDKMEHPDLTPALTPTVRTPQCRHTLRGKKLCWRTATLSLLIIYIYICCFICYIYIWLHMIIYDYIWLYYWWYIPDISLVIRLYLHYWWKTTPFLLVPEVFIPHWLGVPLGLGDGFHFPTLTIYFIDCLYYIYIYMYVCVIVVL